MKSQKNRNYVRACLRDAFARGEGAREILRWQWVNAKESHLADRSRKDFTLACNEIRRDEAIAKARADAVNKASALFRDAAPPRGCGLN